MKIGSQHRYRVRGEQMRHRVQTVLKSFLIAALFGAIAAPLSAETGSENQQTVGPVLWQPSMNVFRRFDGDAADMYRFYNEVLGFESLNTFDVGGNTQVMRIRAGASELKFTGRVPDRQYVEGGVTNATGLRLWTFFFSDEEALSRRFAEHGLPEPQFESTDAGTRRSAIVRDPDGQIVELVITGDPPGTSYDEIELGFVVSDIDASLAFYRDFVGLEPVGSIHDSRFGTDKHIFRHGSTIVTLRSFGAGLPADTGSAGDVMHLRANPANEVFPGVRGAVTPG